MKRQAIVDSFEANMNGDDGLRQNFLNSSDDELDLLHSESSFLPVYSTLKEPHVSQSFENGDYPSDFEQSVMWDTRSGSAAGNEDFPIMTEEEANKLIHLAATILQAHIRGFLVRRKFDFKNFKRKHNAASKIQASWKGYHFRHRNHQWLNFKCELRTQRLQKYVATLGIMMQKAEKQHEEEKQKLLEVVSLLYDKVKYLESSLAVNTERCDSAVATTQELHRAFLPHPRLFEENGDKDDVIETVDKVKVLGSSSDGSDGGEEDEADINEDIKMPLCEDILEQDNSLILEDGVEEEDIEEGGGEDIEDNEKRVVHAMDNEDLVEELRFVEKEMGEKVESNDEVSAEEIQDECEKEHTEEDENRNGVNQDIAQITDEEYDDEEGENGIIVDQMIHHLNGEGIGEDEEGVIDVKFDDSLETEELTTEVEIEGMIGDLVLKGDSEESKEPEDHSGTVEEIKGCSIECAQEKYVEDGDDENMDKKEDNKNVGNTEDTAGQCVTVQAVPLSLTRSPSLGEQNGCCDTKTEETTEETHGKISAHGITQDVKVHVEKHDDSDFANFNEAPEKNTQGGFQGEDESRSSETDTTHLSPRLGKRASSLLSALKDEISNVRPETEHPSSAQAVSQHSSSDADNANVDDNASSECEVITSVDSELTFTVDNGDNQKINLE